MTHSLLRQLGARLALAAALAVPLAAGAAPAAIDVVTTARDTGQRLAPGARLALAPAVQPTETEYSIVVDPAHRYQALIGIGGAITDAAAETFARMAPGQQQAMLRAYFDPDDGIGYTLARTTIHSSDFSSASYTYVREGDASLASFSVDHDRAYRLPLLRRALDAAHGKLKVFASPWSAPAFMKSNGDMLHGGTLLPRYAATWAGYLVRFVRAYEREGVPIWALTVQNEPLASQRWESMTFSAEQERDFIGAQLGPALRAAGLARVKLIAWDHNRDLLPHRARVLLADPRAARYVWGLGYHWYETWTGGEPMTRNVAEVHAAWPDKHLLLTEATVEKFAPERLQYWPNAERYGAAIIGDLNAGAEAWTDWNILLDEQGGPNHVGNFCFAPLHFDTRSHELLFTPSYYYIGHFAKYIRPGARRIAASASRSALQVTAFRNPDGSVAAVVMNGSDQPLRYRFQLGGEEAMVDIPAHAIQTLRR